MSPKCQFSIFDIEARYNHHEKIWNSLYKVDTLVAALTEFRAGLAEEARLYAERAPEVERLNRSLPRPRGARRAASVSSGRDDR